jgi:putative transposase
MFRGCYTSPIMSDSFRGSDLPVLPLAPFAVHGRSDFLHKHSTAVIRKYGTVKVEGLNVSAMSRGNLAKQILDCSWSEWFRQLRYKAEEAGRRLVAVDPKYTSQIGSQCGFKHPDNRKTQADFECLSCEYQDNADHNAAVNILARNEPLRR